MQPSFRIVVSLVLLYSAMATAYHSSAKLRRDGVLNLYPFPRVGRASRHTWQVPINDLYLDYEPVEKRQLYAFPRVGRDMPSLRDPYAEHIQAPVKRTDNPGMWFGPRLGRSFKSDEDDITVQSERVARSDPERMEPLHEDREKRQVEN
ncbi:CAPA peptides [Ostrinia furnacalis]|uniref:CAPA peptides n=1 Tax=Ostrinia furnacalis TaxID=93504 RepID=UPI00103C33EA|nr:CAPA peptides [Ostrinia furnacalis]